ncbi:hypothetical protein [Tateyamaria sp.]|uniref:hypothetical protein n=1 Tax=Tateyamaria sp. TaxID=1929288 RepID=UPI00329C4EA2
MDQTFFINLRVLRRLSKHMQRHHPKEYAMMQRMAPPDLHLGGSWERELQVLQSACVNPKKFPVHVLADHKVVRLIKRAQRGNVGSLWITAARFVLQMVKSQ